MNKPKKKRKIVTFLKKPWALVVVCYVVAVVAFFGSKTIFFAMDKVAMENGTLVEKTLAAEDFDLIEIFPMEDGKYQSISGDPQMILKEVPALVRSFRLEATYSSNPYVIDLYYTTKPGQEYSKDNRVWPVLQPDGSYVFTLPRTHIETFRLDPASAAVQIDFESMTLNPPQSAISYFNPGWAGLVLLLILPAFASAILRFVGNVVQYSKNGKSAKVSKKDEVGKVVGSEE